GRREVIRGGPPGVARRGRVGCHVCLWSAVTGDSGTPPDERAVAGTAPASPCRSCLYSVSSAGYQGVQRRGQGSTNSRRSRGTLMALALPCSITDGLRLRGHLLNNRG